jgi:hypothetical protein
MKRAVRFIAARPGCAAAVVLTVALGLGVNAAIFSMTRAVLLRPLPYRDADRLVMVFETSSANAAAYAPSASVNYVAWRERVNAFERTVAWRRVAFNVSTATSAVAVQGFRIAPTFFPCHRTNEPRSRGSGGPGHPRSRTGGRSAVAGLG